MKTAVFYYSGHGSNRYLAEKTAEALGCETVRLEPRIPGFVIPATFTGLSFGNRKLSRDPSAYDLVILTGPLYMGRIAAPCSDFLKKYAGTIGKAVFITCCGSTDELKDDTFGYGGVFEKLKNRYPGKFSSCMAFPIGLVIPEDKKDDGQAVMNTRLSDDTWNEAAQDRFKSMITELRS